VLCTNARIYLVQYQRLRNFFVVEELVGLRSIQHIVILVLSLDILIVKRSSDAQFQNQHCAGVIVPQFDLGVQALVRDFHPHKSVLDLFGQEGHFSKNVEIQTAFSAPLHFSLRSPSEFRSSVLSARLSLGRDLIFHTGSELGNPFFEDPQEHDRVGFTALIVHAL